jgi:hypothetical protein
VRRSFYFCESHKALPARPQTDQNTTRRAPQLLFLRIAQSTSGKAADRSKYNASCAAALILRSHYGVP